ncbi:MAG TPA: hypothetical protein VK176_07935, partial [Phycisphaerales bacterium]|nr:hypothetical protein [Phycisphaerales bacterium]
DTAPAAVETKPPHAHAAAHPTSAMCTSPAPLASLIPGLDPIKLVCPYAPAIQLALDPAGALHLISCADTFTTLHRAAAWARAHEPLLQAALPHFRSSSTPPTCHVLSEDPAALRPLIESDVRVHLLIKISVGTQEIALAKRLN